MNVNLNPIGTPSPIAPKFSNAAEPAVGSSATASPEPAASPTRPSKEAAGAAGQSSSASLEVQVLQKQIERLQKQLAQQEQQLRAAMSGDKAKDPANAPRVAALQSAVSTTLGQLTEAVAKLAAALLAQGGGSSGNLVSSTA